MTYNVLHTTVLNGEPSDWAMTFDSKEHYQEWKEIHALVISENDRIVAVEGLNLSDPGVVASVQGWWNHAITALVEATRFGHAFVPPDIRLAMDEAADLCLNRARIAWEPHP